MSELSSENSVLAGLIANSLTPLILFLFNYVFIPTLVSIIASYEEYETKSERHRSIFLKLFIYMSINLIFLPITGITTIRSFITYLTS
jgi:hypothetical protein